jgi:hypothetical protein
MNVISAAISVAFLAVGISACPAATLYVDRNNSAPLQPYAEWSTAATDIQAAIDAATDGDVILVTNGIYSPVQVTNVLVIQSVNGPAATIIDGEGARRCVSLASPAFLAGFTLTNGNSGSSSGGGIWCQSTNAVVSNCLLLACTSQRGHGGGVMSGTLYDCAVIACTAPSGHGGGLCSNVVNGCTLASNYSMFGGGAYWSTINNSTIISNSTGLLGDSAGGGLAYCQASNCLIAGNSAPPRYGGGAYGSTLIGCTVAFNRALLGGGAAASILNNCLVCSNGSYGVGGISCTLSNCTIVGNSGGGVIGRNTAYNCISAYNTGGVQFDSDTAISNCCSWTSDAQGDVLEGILAASYQCIPRFVNPAAGDFHLQSNSPCINSGRNAYASGTADLDGNPRIVAGTSDIGAYEYQAPGSIISYAWLREYGLKNDGSADFADRSGTGVNNYVAWRTGKPPGAPLQLYLTPVTSGIQLSWWGGAVPYNLERSTNLSDQSNFTKVAQVICTEIPFIISSMYYFDTNATGPGPFFYRLSVEP